MFADVKVRYLSYSHSDHCPILIQLEKSLYPKERRFRFENWWILESSFLDELQKLWDSEFGDVIAKLDRTRLTLGNWAKSLKRRTGSTEHELQNKLDALVDKDRDDSVLEELIDTKIHMNLEIDKSEMFWEQRARVN